MKDHHDNSRINVVKPTNVGFIGNNAKDVKVTFNQDNRVVSFDAQFDYIKLSIELDQLEQKLFAVLRETGRRSPEIYNDLAKVASAREAAGAKDGNAVIENLKTVGIWIYNAAKDIGSGIVAGIIANQLSR